MRGVTAYGFGPGIEAFTIAADGSITSPQPALIGTGGYSLAMSPNSDYVYFAASDSPDGITVAHQAADGSLSYIPGSPFASGVGFNDVAITPDGKYLFGVGPSHTVSRFSIAADGALTAIGTASVVGAEVLQTSPDGRFLYVMGGSGTDQLYSLSIGSDGSLTQIPPPYDMGATSSGKFAVSPNGSRLYVPNSNSNEIVTLASSASGVLSLVGKTPAADDVKAIAASATGDLFIVQTNTGAGLYHSKPDPFTTIASTPVQLVAENWNYGLRTAFRPGFSGTAGALKITPNAEPLSFTLDATGSTGFNHLEWSTGSPATVTNTTTTKTKFVAAQAGVIPISVRAIDASGCGSDLLYTGQLIVCNSNPAAIKTVNYDTPPWVTKLKLSPKKFQASTKIKFSLTESATVKYRAEAPLKGRMVGKSCKKQTAKRKTGKKCTYWSKVTKNGS
ncbi:MAG: lactonase family protein, partial [Solirubrobacterales bacterium]